MVTVTMWLQKVVYSFSPMLSTTNCNISSLLNDEMHVFKCGAIDPRSSQPIM